MKQHMLYRIAGGLVLIGGLALPAAPPTITISAPMAATASAGMPAMSKEPSWKIGGATAFPRIVRN